MNRRSNYVTASAVLALCLTLNLVTPSLVAAQPTQHEGQQHGGQHQGGAPNGDQRGQPPQPRQQPEQRPQPQQRPQMQQPMQAPQRAQAQQRMQQQRQQRVQQQRAQQRRDRTVQRWTQPLPAPTRPAERTAEVNRMQRNFTVRHRYHAGTYQRPQGYAYRRWSYGQRLPAMYYGRNYWIGNYSLFALFAPPAGLIWVRVGRDAFLIDRYDGEIIQARYNVFY